MSERLEQKLHSLRERYGSPRDPEGRAFAPLAEVLRSLGRLDEAREVLDKGLSRHPDFVPGLVVRARLDRDRDEPRAAQASMRQVLDLDSENVEALRTLGELAQERGDVEGALEYYRRLLDLEPDLADVATRIRELGGEVAPKVVDSPLVLKEEEDEPDVPDLAEAAAELDAEGAWGRGEADGAVDALVEEDEEEGEVYTATMAELYARQGLYRRAMDVYQRLVEADPDNPVFQERLEAIREMALEDAEGGEEPEVESLARDMADMTPEPSVETPFAWGEEEAEGDAGAATRDEAMTAAEYFLELLSWEPAGDTPDEHMGGPTPAEPAREPGLGAVPVATLAPDPAPPGVPKEVEEGAEDPEDAVPVGSLAPDAPSPPPEREEAVPVSSLAPDGPEPRTAEAIRTVPVEALAPDRPVPVGDATVEEVLPEEERVPEEEIWQDEPTAPDETIPVQSLPPDPPAAPAPEPEPQPFVTDASDIPPDDAEDGEREEVDPSIREVLGQIDALGGEEEDEEEDLDDFQKWLDSMKP